MTSHSSRLKILALLAAAALCVCADERDLFKDRYGVGIVRIHEHAEHGILAFGLYDSIGEGRPHAQWIEQNMHSEFFWLKWRQILPFPVFDGGGTPFLVCMEQQGEWYRVRLKEGPDLWIRQEERSSTWGGVSSSYWKLELVPWEQFMANKAWVGRLDPATNPIRTGASSNSKVINYDYGDCLGPIRTKGWWVEVEPVNGEGCITDTTYNEAVFKELFFDRGWVQWRNDSAFLLRTTY